MIITIDQEKFITGLERGALAALSDEAQNDTSGFSLLIKSVKITADSNLTIESGSNLFTSKWTMPAIITNGIDVKLQGEVLIPAKELYNWALKQKGSKIVLKLITEESKLVNVGTGDLDYGSDQKSTVRKIGSVKLLSRDDTKTGNQWSLEAYEIPKMKVIDYEQKDNLLLKINLTNLSKAIDSISFCSLTEDYNHVFDNVSFESLNGDFYAATSDTHRCAIYKLDASINKEYFTNNKKVLVPCKILKQFTKLSEEPEVSIYYNKGKLYLIQDSWKMMVSLIEDKLFDKFPSVSFLFKKNYDKLGNVPKSILNNRIISASLVNKSSILFDFNKQNLVIHSHSENGHAPNVSNAPVQDLLNEAKVVIGVKHISDIIKVVEDVDIRFSISEDKKIVNVSSVEDKNFSYYFMAINNPQYKQLMQG